jgi:adenylate cyclase
MRAARQLFVRAAEIDPGYARALAGIADCDAFLWYSGDIGISYDQMLINSSKALELVPNLAEAHASKGLALYLTGHYDDAASSFERAIKLDPELFGPHYFYGFCCRDQGRFDQAAVLLARAAQLLPGDPYSLSVLADVYNALGRTEECKSACRQAMVRIEARLRQRPDDASALALGAATLVYLDEYARAGEWAKRAIALEPEHFGVRYNAACTYAVMGNSEAALECLDHIASQTPRTRSWLLGIMNHDTQFDSLRTRPDFQAFAKRLESDVAT